MNQPIVAQVEALLKDCHKTESIADYELFKKRVSVLCGEMCMNKADINFRLYDWAVKKAIKKIGI